MSDFFSWRSSFQKSDLPATTKLVLFCISTYMNDHGEGAFPSIETLMQDTSLSNRAVITHIQKAKEAGFLRVSQHGFSGRNWKRNEYRISIPKAVNEVHDQEDGAVNLATRGSEPNDIKAVNEVHTITPYNSPSNSPIEGAQGAKPAKKGMRIENYFKTDRGLPDEYRSEAIRLGLNEPDDEWDSFFDFWAGLAGKDACKLDWLATWRNRVRKAVKRGSGPSRSSWKPAADATVTGARMALDRRRAKDRDLRQPEEVYD